MLLFKKCFVNLRRKSYNLVDDEETNNFQYQVVDHLLWKRQSD